MKISNQVLKAKERLEQLNQEPEVHYGKVIRRYREIAGLTREQCAELMEYSVKGWEKLETGQNKMSLDVLRQASTLLNFSVHYEDGDVLFAHSEDQSRALIHHFLKELKQKLQTLGRKGVSFETFVRQMNELLEQKYLGSEVTCYFSPKLTFTKEEIQKYQWIFKDKAVDEEFIGSCFSYGQEIEPELMNGLIQQPHIFQCFDMEFDLEGHVFNIYLAFEWEDPNCFMQLSQKVIKSEVVDWDLRNWSHVLLKEPAIQDLVLGHFEVHAVFND